MRLTRREFLTSTVLVPGLSSGLGSRVATPSGALSAGCWLEVLIPFVVQDASQGYSSEIVLPSGAFAGRRGYTRDDVFTEYEILGYSQRGEPLKPRRLKLPSMRTTALNLSELYGRAEVLGGARIRMLPHAAPLTHFADLFSAAFVRWNLGGSSYLHAYPDPPQLRKIAHFSVLTLPHPSQPAFLSIFNPNGVDNEALLEVFSREGKSVLRQSTQLAPYSTSIYDLRRNVISEELSSVWNSPEPTEAPSGGTVVVSNPPDKPRVFFFFLSGNGKSQLMSEHPVLQGGFTTKPSSQSPFSESGQFRAQSLLFCPLFFKDYSRRGLTFQSRAFLGAGKPPEAPQWLHPFACGTDGQIYWSSRHDQEFQARNAASLENGILRLAPHQTRLLDSGDLPLESGFAGGLAVACRPVLNQTLLKVEVRIKPWQAVCYSHFRPGATSSRRLLEIKGRDGLVSDYLISGVQVEYEGESYKYDSLLAFMNIDFETEETGEPVVELFGPAGFMARREMGELPGLASRFQWASELFPEALSVSGPFSIRLTDAGSATVLSALHMDFSRRQVAIDHGSDRFSTYLDYSC